MKKPIILVLSLILLCVIGWYANNLMNNSGVSNTELIAFNIKDIETVDKIIIKDAMANKIEIVKNGNEWSTVQGNCIQQESVAFILQAFKNIEFKGYLPEGSRENNLKMLTTQHTSVEIFQNGKWTKTWYIGVSSQDHYGQVMLLDSDEFGKSDLPVIMKIKGVNGIIEPRFFADNRKWMCTKIFEIPLNKIAKVDVKYTQEPSRNFTVSKNGAKLDVKQNGIQLPIEDSLMIFNYLNNFKKIHFESANFELNKKEIDSLKKTTPFAILSVSETNKKTTKLRMFKIKTETQQENEFGVLVDTDIDKFWCELPSKEIVKCQFFVFNPILLGHIYFPLKLDSKVIVK